MKTRTDKRRNNKKLVNKVILITIVLLIITALYFTNILFNDTSVANDIDSQKMLDKAYENDDVMSFTISEKEYQKLLHKMTHQKVESKLKYGIIEMSKENIEAMINILEENKDKYKYYSLYKETLNDWKYGDFDNVVEIHNKMWKFLEKPDGKAYGKMSKKQEAKFIKDQF